jgi:SAM-dependent methyltransferase
VESLKDVAPPETGGMNPAEFANIARWEREFWWFRGQRAILFALLEPFLQGRRIVRALEAGCGTGYFSHLLQCERGWPVVPLDISADGLRYARAMGVEGPVQGDLSHLPFGNNVFDVVMSIDVLPHLVRGGEAAAVGELARVLVPGGLLVVRSAALDILRSRHSDFAFERQRFTRRHLVETFTQCGIRVRRATYANSLLFPVALVKFRLWEPLLKRPAASGIAPLPAWLDALLYWVLASEARWLRAGHDFPVGQSVIVIGEKL